MADLKKIFILGDSSLVEEYAALCAEKGFEVQTITAGNFVFDFVLELTNLSIDSKKSNLIHLENIIPVTTPILSSSVTVTLAGQVPWLKNPERLIGIGAFPTLLQGSLIEFVAGPLTDTSTRNAGEEFATSLDKSAVFVHDSIGLVMPRIISMLVNEACFAMVEGVAAGDDIDTAMKLGTNYPHGPVEWGERIGARNILAVMESLHGNAGDERYRAAPLLRKAAISNRFASE